MGRPTLPVTVVIVDIVDMCAALGARTCTIEYTWYCPVQNFTWQTVRTARDTAPPTGWRPSTDARSQQPSSLNRLVALNIVPGKTTKAEWT